MTALARQQQALLDALLAQPGSQPATGAQERLEGLVLEPSSRGLAAYRANGHALAERALCAAFPVVRALVGEDSFAALARAFWHRHPPQRGDLACWGGDLPGSLANDPQLADVPYLADVAQVEWALHRAAGATDAEADPASFALLTTLDPGELTLRLASGTAVMRSLWPVASLVTAHLHDDPPLAVAGQRVQARVAENAVVWRQALRPRVAPCTPAQAALLRALLNGQSLLTGLDAALACEPGFDFGSWLAGAVAQGQVLGARRQESASAAPEAPGLAAATI